MANKQAREAGNKADEIIKNLANPSGQLVTENTTVDVLDKAQTVEPTQNEPTQVQTENWEKRFKTYKASTDQTLHTLRQNASTFNLLEEQNNTLKKQLEETQAKIPETPNEMLDLFSEEEVNGLGKMFDGKVGVLTNKVVSLEEELEVFREKEKRDAKVSAHQHVVDLLKARIPEYTNIDRNPKFGEYMNSIDEFGNNRFDLLMRAKESTPPDINRIVQFYVEFANQATQVQEEPNKQFTQQELLQNPTSTSSNGGETPRGLGINWTQALVSQLYKDKATGKISTKQFKELEEDMYAVRNRSLKK